MELFGRELTLDQTIGFVRCNAAPNEDLVHMAALELIVALQDAQRMERAAVDTEYEFVGEMNVYTNDAEPDEDHSSSVCVVKCRKCGWHSFGDGWWEAKYGNYQKSEQVPQHCSHCGAKFTDEWRGPQDEEGDKDE